MGSKPLTLDTTDLKKLGKGMLIAAAGAAMTALTTWVSQTDFGIWNTAIAAGYSVLANAVLKYLSDNSGDTK